MLQILQPPNIIVGLYRSARDDYDVARYIPDNGRLEEIGRAGHLPVEFFVTTKSNFNRYTTTPI